MNRRSPFHFARCFKASMSLAPHHYIGAAVQTFVVSHSVPQTVARAFTFVTEAVERALSQAKATAGDKNVQVMSADIAQ